MFIHFFKNKKKSYTPNLNTTEDQKPKSEKIK